MKPREGRVLIRTIKFRLVPPKQVQQNQQESEGGVNQAESRQRSLQKRFQSALQRKSCTLLFPKRKPNPKLAASELHQQVEQQVYLHFLSTVVKKGAGPDLAIRNTRTPAASPLH
ncbi:hypothetical protein VZT92_027795 [Zoarces viviparus]|uniref:Uncharacterized protein n=1 Tax=Zoarces viviparus TaxID=48416 RepID=A0AAW1DW25_ZOAVI